VAVMAAITVENLHKHYGAFHAVDGVSFSVEAGEVFALLGPNGAGKTTTVEILEGHRERTGGTVDVARVRSGNGRSGLLGTAPEAPRALTRHSPGPGWTLRELDQRGGHDWLARARRSPCRPRLRMGAPAIGPLPGRLVR
jgi:ABC-type Mn2+/Zn2+ transport system ATPase subunit